MVGKEIGGFLRGLGFDSWGGDKRAGALRVAGAGSLGGAAAVAAWVCRRELQTWDDDGSTARAALTVLAERPREWRLELAARLVARLRLAELLDWGGDPVPWEIAAGLLRAEGAPPPATLAFAAAWLRFRRPEPVAEDPFFPVLVPVLFAEDGVGGALLDQAPVGPPEVLEHNASLTLAEEIIAHVDRGFLLDGCVRRFLRGGKGRQIAWYVALHRVLAPTPEESAPRLRDYVRLLPDAALPVAELAFEQVRAVDALAPLPEETFAETTAALLFRTERKLLRAALGWLDRTAGGRERATVAAAVAAFAIDHADTRERAVRLAVRHSDAADPLTAEAVRAASTELPAPLREKIAAAYGKVAEPAPVEVTALYPVAPRELDPPIASSAELLAEVLAHLRAPDAAPWSDVERLVAGLVTFGGAVFAEARAHAERYAWPMRQGGAMDGVVLVFNALVRTTRPGELDEELRVRLARADGASARPSPATFLRKRYLEAALHLGDPVLLATPTSASGHLDPEVFAHRLRTLEEAGVEPGPVDLAQALLRLPRDAGPLPSGLVSPSAETVRAWIAAGGLPDPDDALTTAVSGRLRALADGVGPRFAGSIHAYPDLPPELPLGEAAPLLEAKPWHFGHHGSVPWWPSVMPSHRELTALHMMCQVRAWPEERYGQGGIVLSLSDATGPTGNATAAVLLFALASKHQRERAGALDALLSFAAHDALPARDLGALLAMFTGSGTILLPRVVKALTDATLAGANLWPVLAEAIPALLPTPAAAPPRGLNDLLALATRTAELHHIRTPIPALTAWTPLSRTSRTTKEATTLHQTLTSP